MYARIKVSPGSSWFKGKVRSLTKRTAALCIELATARVRIVQDR